MPPCLRASRLLSWLMSQEYGFVIGSVSSWVSYLRLRCHACGFSPVSLVTVVCCCIRQLISLQSTCTSTRCHVTREVGSKVQVCSCTHVIVTSRDPKRGTVASLGRPARNLTTIAHFSCSKKCVVVVSQCRGLHCGNIQVWINCNEVQIIYIMLLVESTLQFQSCAHIPMDRLPYAICLTIFLFWWRERESVK